MTKHRRPTAEPPLLDDARALLAGIEDLERLAARVAETNLPTGRAITRCGEMLTDALGAHQRFVAALQAEEVRDQLASMLRRVESAAPEASRYS